jgi:hypothetical protein
MSVEDILRQALDAEAEKVDVAPDALHVIRTRIARRRGRFGMPWLPRGVALFAMTGGTAVVAAALVALALLGVPRFGNQASPGGSGGATVPPSANLPVYYVGQTGAGPRLYREYHPLLVADQSPASKAEAAVEALLDPHSAFDPDYAGGWPGGVSVHLVRVDGDTATVELTGLPAGYSVPGIAREELIWTVTASTGVPRVQLVLDGQRSGAPLVRGPATDVLAPVWLIDPQEGAPVGHVITVRLAGSVPSGTVWLRVRTLTGAVVVDQSVQLSAAAPDRGEGSATVTLASGTYVVEAYTGAQQYLDSHRISVP